MSELNLDFDPDKKNITMSNHTNDNLGFTTDTNHLKIEELNSDPSISPNLRTSDSIHLVMVDTSLNSPL